ncbi:MAG: ribonuclease HII [Clostridia bacterium]|nr:ribonuclease HII [Clostridia bacterium]
MPRVNEAERLFAITEIERGYWERGILPGGMDEVGRGPLAGPVAVACVVLPPEPLIEGVKDSKKVTSEAKRERLAAAIREGALSYGIGMVEPERIDEVNILNATKEAYALAYRNMSTPPSIVLVDAVQGLDIPAEQHAFIKGDAKSYLIGAASLVAKVARDELMRKYDEMYPGYGFIRNKGYGTAEHIAALKKYGPCPIHRRSFIGNFVEV